MTGLRCAGWETDGALIGRYRQALEELEAFRPEPAVFALDIYLDANCTLIDDTEKDQRLCMSYVLAMLRRDIERARDRLANRIRERGGEIREGRGAWYLDGSGVPCFEDFSADSAGSEDSA